jgi:hypothetical protein
MEEWQPDGTWKPTEEQTKIGDAEVTLPVQKGDDGLQVEPEESGVKAPKPAEETGNAAGPQGGEASDVIGDLFSTDVKAPLQIDTAPVQAEAQAEPQAVENGTGDLDFDVPGLTQGDAKKGSSGQKSVLARLQDRARGRVARPNGSSSGKNAGKGKATPVRVEVSERAAVATGPAVKDTTESRQKGRGKGGSGPQSAGSRSVGTKPAPGILGDQPKWVQELFEAHFRSTRTAELRRKPTGPQRSDGSYPDRMKLSREDFAIGWLVMLEAARRDSGILRLKELKGRSSVSAPTEPVPATP